MTTYTDEVNIYNPEAIAQGITEAGETATSYITEVTQDGIVVAEAGKGASNGSITSGTTGWHLGAALEYIRAGVARFWIGLKDSVHDLTPTVIIGKRFVSGATDNESHMELDYHSIQLVDKEGETYFHVSDLRDQSGLASLVEQYGGDADGVYYLSLEASSTDYTVKVYDDNGNDVSSSYPVQSRSLVSVTVPNVPSNYTVEVSYTTASGMAKAYTAGVRDSAYGIGPMSLAEGYGTVSAGWCSHAEGRNAKSQGDASHAEGSAFARGENSHAEGATTYTDGFGCHSEGYSTSAYATASHAEGGSTQATNSYAHAEGYQAVASGIRSHAQNHGTIARGSDQTAIGRFNSEDANERYALIVGNGTDATHRSNAFTVDWAGKVDAASATFSGGLTASSINEGAIPSGMSPGKIYSNSSSTSYEIFSANTSNVSVGSCSYKEWGKVAMVQLTVYLKSALSTGTSGNIPNIEIGTMTAGRRPAFNTCAFIPEYGGIVSINTAGVMSLGCLLPNQTISTDAALYIRGTYVLS